MRLAGHLSPPSLASPCRLLPSPHLHKRSPVAKRSDFFYASGGGSARSGGAEARSGGGDGDGGSGASPPAPPRHLPRAAPRAPSQVATSSGAKREQQSKLAARKGCWRQELRRLEQREAGGLSEDDLRLRSASEVLASPGKLMREKTLALALAAAFACSASCRDANGGGGAGRRSGRRRSGLRDGGGGSRARSVLLAGGGGGAATCGGGARLGRRSEGGRAGIVKILERKGFFCKMTFKFKSNSSSDS